MTCFPPSFLLIFHIYQLRFCEVRCLFWLKRSLLVAVCLIQNKLYKYLFYRHSYSSSKNASLLLMKPVEGLTNLLVALFILAGNWRGQLKMTQALHNGSRWILNKSFIFIAIPLLFHASARFGIFEWNVKETVWSSLRTIWYIFD